ncbi:GTP-binding protein Rheb [Merluccius polli]|uniref:GTP-binding protein Rheb n=1 Tax=Merluccius polli TaxID=89951 RepID=A0AA47MXT4_MERPO|nr:GTP-binding protein Rheb [Merluccius polli]
MVSVNSQDFNLQLVDTAGQDEYSIFPQSHSMDIHGYVLVYAVTSSKRVIKPEEGKKLADSWGAAFMESSAKENETAVEVFKRIILEMERADGNVPSEEKKCAVM